MFLVCSLWSQECGSHRLGSFLIITTNIGHLQWIQVCQLGSGVMNYYYFFSQISEICLSIRAVEVKNSLVWPTENMNSAVSGCLLRDSSSWKFLSSSGILVQPQVLVSFGYRGSSWAWFELILVEKIARVLVSVCLPHPFHTLLRERQASESQSKCGEWLCLKPSDWDLMHETSLQVNILVCDGRGNQVLLLFFHTYSSCCCQDMFPSFVPLFSMLSTYYLHFHYVF